MPNISENINKDFVNAFTLYL